MREREVAVGEREAREKERQTDRKTDRRANIVTDGQTDTDNAPLHGHWLVQEALQLCFVCVGSEGAEEDGGTVTDLKGGKRR